MTITIKARTAMFALALLCVLAGLAIGQLTHANSASSNYQLSQIAGELRRINSALGTSGSTFSGVNGKLRQIEESSAATCRAVDGSGC